jgi:hypothetical protein
VYYGWDFLVHSMGRTIVNTEVRESPELPGLDNITDVVNV